MLLQRFEWLTHLQPEGGEVGGDDEEEEDEDVDRAAEDMLDEVIVDWETAEMAARMWLRVTEEEEERDACDRDDTDRVADSVNADEQVVEDRIDEIRWAAPHERTAARPNMAVKRAGAGNRYRVPADVSCCNAMEQV